MTQVRDLLILLLRSQWDQEALYRAGDHFEANPLAWNAVIPDGLAGGLGPLLFHNLQFQTWLPGDIRQQLQAAFVDTAAQNLLLLTACRELTGSLAASAIPVIALKGVALIETVYDNPALRPMVDLDLLLHRQDIPAALALLAQAGYRTGTPEPQPGLTLAFENELVLHRPGVLDVRLELHWRLLDSPYYQRLIDPAWFWQTARPVAAAHRPFLVLGPEAQLLHLCSHQALHHGGERLLWRHDVAALLHAWRHQFDWDLLLARAQAYDLVLSLQQVLLAVSTGWAAPIPQPILDRLQALTPSPAEVRVYNRLTAARRPVVHRFWTDLAGQPGWRPRFSYAFAQLFPTPAYITARYAPAHPLLLPLYYPYRWLRGLRGLLPHPAPRTPHP